MQADESSRDGSTPEPAGDCAAPRVTIYDVWTPGGAMARGGRYAELFTLQAAAYRGGTEVGEGGFEPPKAEPTGLQPVPFGHSGTPPEAGAL